MGATGRVSSFSKCSGGFREGARGTRLPPLFLDQTEKMFFGDRPPPLYQDLDDRPPRLSVGLDPPLKWIAFRFRYPLLASVAIKAVVKEKGQ